MILKSNAIVLAISAFSQTSHIITWLTRDYGRVTTAAKGACRVKSALLGQYDLFYTNELLFYRRSSHNGIHAIRECAPLNFREELRADWRAASAARYLTDLTARLSVSTAAREVYDDLSHALDVLCNCEHSSIESLIFFIPMPESWSKKKKEQLCGTLHEQKPDIDNLTKSLFDALCDEDSHIALIKGPLTKIWADEGKIAISY